MEIYVVESHNNGTVSQLFRSNKILLSFGSDFLKRQSCKHKHEIDSGAIFLKRTWQSLIFLQDGAKNEKNQMDDSELA